MHRVAFATQALQGVLRSPARPPACRPTQQHPRNLPTSMQMPHLGPSGSGSGGGRAAAARAACTSMAFIGDSCATCCCCGDGRGRFTPRIGPRCARCTVLRTICSSPSPSGGESLVRSMTSPPPPPAPAADARRCCGCGCCWRPAVPAGACREGPAPRPLLERCRQAGGERQGWLAARQAGRGAPRQPRREPRQPFSLIVSGLPTCCCGCGWSSSLSSRQMTSACGGPAAPAGATPAAAILGDCVAGPLSGAESELLVERKTRRASEQAAGGPWPNWRTGRGV